MSRPRRSLMPALETLGLRLAPSGGDYTCVAVSAEISAVEQMTSDQNTPGPATPPGGGTDMPQLTPMPVDFVDTVLDSEEDPMAPPELPDGEI